MFIWYHNESLKMFTTKIYLNSCHLCYPNNSEVKKALQTRSFKIFATTTRQCRSEITKRENSSSKKDNSSKIELFIPLKILNYFFTDTGHSNSLRKKSTYVKSQKIHVLDKWPTLTKIPHEHVPK